MAVMTTDVVLKEEDNKRKMKTSEKKRLVDIGTVLGSLSEEDKKFILNPDTTESQCQARMIAARHRMRD